MLEFLNPYMLWVKLGAAALGFLAIFGSGMWLEGKFKQHEIDGLKLAAAQKQAVDVTTSLNQLKTFISNVQLAAIGYQSDRDAVNAKLNTLARTFATAIKASPLPKGCAPDSVRQESLVAAVAAANTVQK